MRDPSYAMSHWAKLSIAGFTIGASYFIVQALLTTQQWWLLGLLLVFVLLTTLMAIPIIKHWQQGALSILFLLSIVMIFFIHQHASMLYVVVCLLAIETFNKRKAIIWVIACVIAVFSSELISSANIVDIQDAFVNSLLTLFLSGFAFLRIEAELGRRQTRQLLHQVEDKNRQLATFTAEREQQSRKEERQHLSRELHDTLGHKLTTSIVQLEAAEKFFEKDPRRVRNILDTVRNLLKEGLNETRNIVRLLDQEVTKEQALVDVITPLARSFESATGLSVSVQLECDDTLIPAGGKQHILRVVQEALTNISRHAEATKVNIKLMVDDIIELRIEDNGVRLNDYDGTSLPPLKSIESRVAELQGKLNFVREGTLTKLIIQIPVKEFGDNRYGGDHAHKSDAG